MNSIKSLIAILAAAVCLAGCGEGAVDEKDSIEGQLKEANVGAKAPVTKGGMPSADKPK
jgi:hypothetical protein